jgi:hypothetical protein
MRLWDWFRDRRVTPDDEERLTAEADFAETDVQVSRAARQWAERVGAEQRRQLGHNHFGERMAAALEPRGGYPA